MKIFGSIQELVDLVYRIGSNTVTLRPNASQATTATVSLPNVTTATDTVVTQAASQALSNKTSIGVGSLTLASQSISSVGDLGLNAGGTGSVKINSDLNIYNGKNIGLFDSTNTYSLVLRVPSLANNRIVNLPDVSGTVVLEAAIQTLTNKTIDTASNTLKISGTTINSTTGSGAVVLATSPSLVTPSLGVATASSINKLLITAPTSAATLTLADGSTLATSGAFSTTLTATGATNVTLPTSGTLATLAGSETLLNKQISSTAAITGALTLPAGTEAQRPTPVEGMVRLNTDTDSFEGYANGVWSGIGGGGTTDRITQASHGFVVGDVLYLNGATYTKAIASAANTAEAVGMVSRVIDINTFELTLSGEVSGLTGLTAGEVYFLSAATAGATTITEPSTIGQVSVPIGVASSTTTMYVAPKRGVVIGGVNARTEVALTSGATTNVQNVAGMSAGELSGWVFISSAAPKRFYISAKFSLSGAGGDYNLSYQTSGDTPPTGFLMDITTTGIIRVTLPAASGTTSAINYALNAPAIGASFPLTVDAGTILSGTVGAARLPAPTAYADAEATRMGLKIYQHGVAYNSGISPTIAVVGGYGTLSSVTKSNFIPYQMQDGTWRLKFTMQVIVNSQSRTTFGLTVNGITNKNIALFYQPIIGFQYNSSASYASYCYVEPNTNQFYCNHAAATATNYGLSGDIELETKPTWAY